MSGSIFSEVTQTNFVNTPDIDDMDLLKVMFSSIQKLVSENKILALHDVSDGGLITTLLEMAFTKKIGLKIKDQELTKGNLNNYFFSEESGLVIQIADSDIETIQEQLLSVGLSAKIIASTFR
jgi:phosphoribosylformylglycinamidine synthase